MIKPKTLIIIMSITAILLSALLVGLGSPKAAQKTDTLEVRGNCEMCKKRIEGAAMKAKGVKYANWDVKAKELTLEYDDTLAKLEDVERRIAAAGHDTEHLRADDKAYAALPGCCQYPRR